MTRRPLTGPNSNECFAPAGAVVLCRYRVMILPSIDVYPGWNRGSPNRGFSWTAFGCCRGSRLGIFLIGGFLLIAGNGCAFAGGCPARCASADALAPPSIGNFKRL